MKKILESTETTGQPFRAAGGVLIIQLEEHAGGTWRLEARSVSNPTVWVEDEMTFTDDGRKAFYASPELDYRLTGGAVGAVAYLLSNRDDGTVI